MTRTPPHTAAIQRFERKRAEILEAAREVFTREGYTGASMDAVAAESGASKRTLYQYFADKEELFAAAVLDTVDWGYEYHKPLILAVADTDDVAAGLTQLARTAIKGMTNPGVLKIRRLVIAETERFPEIGRQFYEQGWARTVGLLAEVFSTLTKRGLLSVADPQAAAYLFTWMIQAKSATETFFLGSAAAGTEAELLAQADEGARVFLAAYATKPQSNSIETPPAADTPEAGLLRVRADSRPSARALPSQPRRPRRSR